MQTRDLNRQMEALRARMAQVADLQRERRELVERGKDRTWPSDWALRLEEIDAALLLTGNTLASGPDDRRPEEMRGQRISVLLVDDHSVAREHYRRLLEECGGIRVLGEAPDTREAVEKVRALRPDVVVMALDSPVLGGAEGIRRILVERSDARVLVFSMCEDPILVRRSLEAGAYGYMTKTSAPSILVDAVEAVAAGKRYLSHDVAQALAFAASAPDPAARNGLSSRKLAVVELLVRSQSLRYRSAAVPSQSEADGDASLDQAEARLQEQLVFTDGR
jgi:two-component system invasion response regulator UvrY